MIRSEAYLLDPNNQSDNDEAGGPSAVRIEENGHVIGDNCFDEWLKHHTFGRDPRVCRMPPSAANMQNLSLQRLA